MIEELKKAGKICKKALNLAEKLTKPEVKLIEIAEEIENFILDNNAFPAFPVNISINNVAAHYTPDINDEKEIREGDVVKIDVGVHINGYICDGAITIEVNDNKYKDLINASKEALENVKKIIRKDITLSEIGKTIEETIKKYGFNPIYNLSGHKIERYILHAGLTIPNFDNKSKIKLGEGIYAIEPFATDGMGYVKDDVGSKIYSIVEYKPVRIPSLKKFLDKIYEKYKHLPFARRWLIKEFKNENVDLYLNMLKKEGIIYEYPVLVEKSNGIVSQFEKTFIIIDKPYDALDSNE